MLETPQEELDLAIHTELVIGQSAGNFSKNMKNKLYIISQLKKLNSIKKQKKKVVQNRNQKTFHGNRKPKNLRQV